MGEKCPKSLAEESFTAGLLHEIGKLVLLAQMPDEYNRVLQKLTDNVASVVAAEQQEFGCTHADLGAYLMSIWGLPHPLIHAVAYHDRPSTSVEKAFSSLTAVHAADAIISSASRCAILQDVQLDETYLDHLHLTARLPAWRGLFDQQQEQARANAAKAAAL
jgi:HD-like signal output (HDOD) protein